VAVEVVVMNHKIQVLLVVLAVVAVEVLLPLVAQETLLQLVHHKETAAVQMALLEVR